MSDERSIETQADLLRLLDEIDRLLGEVRDRVIDQDPEMHEVLRKAKNGDH